PDIAAGDGDPDTDVATERAIVEELGQALPAERTEEFYALMQHEELDPAAARELAAMFLPLLGSDLAEAGDTEPPELDDVLAGWRETPTARGGPDPDDLGYYSNQGPAGEEGAGGGAPEAAGLKGFDPRDLVRAFTVWQMKDRAGVVGSRGVAALLTDLLQQPSPPVH